MCQRNPQVCGPGRCIPRPRGYTCTCDSGFRLSPQGTHCIGELDRVGGRRRAGDCAGPPPDQPAPCSQMWTNAVACPRPVLPGVAKTRQAASVVCAAPASELARGLLSVWVRNPLQPAPGFTPAGILGLLSLQSRPLPLTLPQPLRPYSVSLAPGPPLPQTSSPSPLGPSTASSRPSRSSRPGPVPILLLLNLLWRPGPGFALPRPPSSTHIPDSRPLAPPLPCARLAPARP